MDNILITGGCGFIGSNFIKYILANNLGRVINIDKLTYAGKGRNIEYMGLAGDKNYTFYPGDICDKGFLQKVFSKEKPDIVFNFAAESHVDRSIKDSGDFVNTNIVGVLALLDVSKEHNIKKFIQISTDEVYGSLEQDSPSSKETDLLNPRSPYSASKAAAEHLVFSYFYTHKLPIIITRSSNNYGPFQFPEKLIPLFITNLIEGKKVPLMWSPENPGLNVRDWLHVEDNCRAIWLISQKGNVGEIYNIPSKNEKTNIEITKEILNHFNLGEDRIECIPHRAGHDFRYSILGDRLLSLGFKCEYRNFQEGLKQTIDWYKENKEWWLPLKKAD